MNCRQVIPDLIDVARGMAIDRTRQKTVRDHVATCASCAARLESEQAMTVALARVAGAPEAFSDDDAQFPKLLAAFDTAFVRPRQPSFRVWLPVAASLTIVVGLMVGWTHDGLPPAAGDTAASASASRGDASFVLVPDAGALPRFDHGELIRVEIPSAAGPIHAEVLVGQDGFARAVRVID